MILRAPAKINWFLQVAGRRGDGYHDIVSPMQKVSLYDTLEFEDSEEIELISDIDIPVKDNLVFRAAHLLKDFSGYLRGARIKLIKNIPSMAGLGGGSSDAATALIGLNRLWSVGIDDVTLMNLGARLGSDVPFFIGKPFALVQGRGEKVVPLASGRSHSILLVKPEAAVSTAWAYQNLGKLTKNTVDITLFCQALDAGDFVTLRQLVFNDLEQVVIKEHRVIGGIKSKLLEQGAEFSLMSGSGSAVFGVFRTPEAAQKAAGALADTWLCVVNTIVDEDC